MIGQTKLLNLVDDYIKNGFPKSLILSGECGCGKHTLMKDIVKRLEIECVDITERIDLDTINEAYMSSERRMYVIDTSGITDKEQNMILKFIEEPPCNSYVMLLSSNEQNLLDTIKNRCIVLRFDEYSRDELMHFIVNKEDEKYLEYIKTPKEAEELDSKKLDSMIKVCNNIANKLDIASFTNTLSIVNKFASEEWDLTMFFRILCVTLEKAYISLDNQKLFDYYNIVREYFSYYTRDTRLNKQNLLTNCLIKMWEKSRE